MPKSLEPIEQETVQAYCTAISPRGISVYSDVTSVGTSSMLGGKFSFSNIWRTPAQMAVIHVHLPLCVQPCMLKWYQMYQI